MKLVYLFLSELQGHRGKSTVFIHANPVIVEAKLARVKEFQGGELEYDEASWQVPLPRDYHTAGSVKESTGVLSVW